MMKAAVLHAQRDLRFEERPVPVPSQGEVLVRICFVGVCGSDVHYYVHGRIGRYLVEQPIVLGHECSGVVEALGPGVTHLEVEDHVAIEPGYPCRHCRYCKEGRYNLCPNVTFMATPPVDGAFTEYVAWPADFVFKLPKSVSLEEGALLEPFCVGLHAVRRSKAEPGKTAVILGTGTIGLMILQAARAYGLTSLVGVDIDHHRLELAGRLGACLTIDSTCQDVIKAMAEFGLSSVNTVFDAAGVPSTLALGPQLVESGGRIVWVGMAEEPASIPVSELIFKEVDIITTFRSVAEFPLGIRLFESGLVRPAPMITHRFPFDQLEQALNITYQRADGAIKVLIAI